MMTEYQGQDFQEVVGEGLVLVDFFATWCMPNGYAGFRPNCSELDYVKIYKVDIDKFRQLAIDFKLEEFQL